MMPTLESLGLDRLTTEERIHVAMELWDSVPESAASKGLTREQVEDLDQRLAEHEANPDDVIPWEQVRADLLVRAK